MNFLLIAPTPYHPSHPSKLPTISYVLPQLPHDITPSAHFIDIGVWLQYFQAMNLKQRMQHQNRNNSEILNNSNFDFAKPNKQDQIYGRSRQECEQQLYKRKSQLEQEKYTLIKLKQKELNSGLQRFANDFQQIRKQIINHLNLSLSETKARFLSQIRQRCLIETTEQQRIKNSIDELLNVINNHLAGLKKQQYREYIARIVTTDFDTSKEELKAAVRRVRYGSPQVVFDEKYYNCLRNDILKAVVIDYNFRRDAGQESRQTEMTQRTVPLSVEANFHQNRVNLNENRVNLHENRDRLKKSFQ